VCYEEPTRALQQTRRGIASSELPIRRCRQSVFPTILEAALLPSAGIHLGPILSGVLNRSEATARSLFAEEGEP
jgi:hypothetical protein